MLARVSTRYCQGVGDIVVSLCRRTVLCRKHLIALSSNKLWILHFRSRSSCLRWPYVVIAAPFRQRSWQACNHQGACPSCDRSSRSSELLHAGAVLILVMALGFSQFPCMSTVVDTSGMAAQVASTVSTSQWRPRDQLPAVPPDHTCCKRRNSSHPSAWKVAITSATCLAFDDLICEQ